MPSNRTIRKRKKNSLDPWIYSFFAYLGGANMLKKKHGESYLRRQWKEHGRAFLDNWNYDRPPLILKVYGEPEKQIITEGMKNEN